MPSQRRRRSQRLLSQNKSAEDTDAANHDDKPTLRQRKTSARTTKSSSTPPPAKEEAATTKRQKRTRSTSSDDSALVPPPPPTEKKTRRAVATRKSPRTKKPSSSSSALPNSVTSKKSAPTLPRTRERALQSLSQNNNDDDDDTTLLVIGVDEAGRGPIAGPVVAAAVTILTTPSSSHSPPVVGITDSKKLSESDRERLFDELITRKDVKWCAAVVDHERIDEINILEATLEAMRMAVDGVVVTNGGSRNGDVTVVSKISIDHTGSYILRRESSDTTTAAASASLRYHALIDGNKIPKSLPCPSECVVKGDSKEYCIGAASVVAKVVRDRLMAEYDKLYPIYNLKKHKGYPTREHVGVVLKEGPCAIHRRTFAPIKNMDL